MRAPFCPEPLTTATVELLLRPISDFCLLTICEELNNADAARFSAAMLAGEDEPRGDLTKCTNGTC